MGALIDTSVFIAAERGDFDLASWLEKHGDETFGMSAITLSELWHGVHRAKPERRRRARAAFVRGVFDSFPVYPFDATAAEVHARIWADLAGRGALIGAHDLIIAATALSRDHAVATRNIDHFKRVRRLRVIAP